MQIHTILSMVKLMKKFIKSLLHQGWKFLPLNLHFGRVVIIFQMGRVGSTSIFAPLRRIESKDAITRSRRSAVYRVYRVHESKDVHFNNLKKPNMTWRPISVICPIREPIDRSVSAFFYFYYEQVLREHLENTDIPIQDLKTLFLKDSRPHESLKSKLSRLAEHNFCLNWFDIHFQTQLRIDVYKTPFDKTRKYQEYKRGGTRVLLYRSDLDISEQARLISRFLGIRLEIKPKNEAEHLTYGGLYGRFRESAKLPESYIRRMHDSRFAEHFWSPEELKAAADKWRVGSGS